MYCLRPGDNFIRSVRESRASELQTVQLGGGVPAGRRGAGREEGSEKGWRPREVGPDQRERAKKMKCERSSGAGPGSAGL